MTSPLFPLEIFLHSGDYYFADRDTRIRTVLGSCVAITFWHPQLRLGGMCHYMLPERGSDRVTHDRPGRYADTAVALQLEEMDAVGTLHQEYQVKLFGGGNMFPETHKNMNTMFQVGSRNVQAARQLAKQHGFTCVAEHLGDIGHRNVIFEVWSGQAWVKHSHILPVFEYEPISRDQQ